MAKNDLFYKDTAASELKGYVTPQYLRFTAQLARQSKLRSYELMRIQAGQRVLDVGCGPGSDTISLAHLVGPTGLVVGIDHDENMIAEAHHLASKKGVNEWVIYKQTDAGTLPFEPDYFDSCRSERLFQHLSDPDKVLAEMKRVTRSGGWIVAVDTDWGTLSIDVSDIHIERKFTRFLAEQYTLNGYSGRQLFRLFKKQDFVDIEVEVIPFRFLDYSTACSLLCLEKTQREANLRGIFTREELLNWKQALSDADTKGVFFASVCSIAVAGRKP